MLTPPPAQRMRRRPPCAVSPLDGAFSAARGSRDARQRLWAGALESLVTLIPADLALAYTVDERRVRRPAMAYAPAGGADGLEALAHQLARLEPIDPFGVARAEAVRARVRSAADAGGPERLARSLYGRHLSRLGVRPPLFAYFWRARRIVAGVALVRSPQAPDFEPAAADLLARLQPLLEDTLTGPFEVPPGAAESEVALPCPLTAREEEVVRRVLAGDRNAEIAAALGMSEATVKTHLTHVYEKAGVRSRTELSARARRGWLRALVPA